SPLRCFAERVIGRPLPRHAAKQRFQLSFRHSDNLPPDIMLPRQAQALALAELIAAPLGVRGPIQKSLKVAPICPAYYKMTSWTEGQRPLHVGSRRIGNAAVCGCSLGHTKLAERAPRRALQ